MSIAGCGDAESAVASRQHTETREGGRPVAQVIRLHDVRAAADPPHRANPATGIRRAARELAETAAEMTACSDKMRASMAILARSNVALRTQVARARQIVGDSERIVQAIEAGDLDTMIALRAELFGGV
jgi:hypothetical protein